MLVSPCLASMCAHACSCFGCSGTESAGELGRCILECLWGFYLQLQDMLMACLQHLLQRVYSGVTPAGQRPGRCLGGPAPWRSVCFFMSGSCQGTGEVPHTGS